MTTDRQNTAPERIVASVDWETVNNIRLKFGFITVGTQGVPDPFEPTHYLREDTAISIKDHDRLMVEAIVKAMMSGINIATTTSIEDLPQAINDAILAALQDNKL